MKLPAHSSKGMTLVELLIVLALFTMVFALSSISLSGLIPKTNSQEYTEIIISDLRRHQMQAMQGNNLAQGSATAQGVYFSQNKYTLFEGVSYDASAAANIATTLPPDLEFTSITLPSQQLVFQQVSGEVQNYDQNNDTFTLANSSTGYQVQFEVNQLGVIEVTQ